MYLTGSHIWNNTFTAVGRSEGWATFSPHSTRILYKSFIADRNQLFVAPVGGCGPPIAIGPSYREVGGSLGGMFSPDGRWVIVSDPNSGETRLVDAATGGNGELLPWSTADISAWQRLAP